MADDVDGGASAAEALASPPPVRKPPSRFLTVTAGLVGNVLEWYDFTVFGTFAAELGLLFFPAEDQAASLMETFAVFGGAFLMRPLGAAIFGYIGDRVGRRQALWCAGPLQMISVLLMAISSFAVGCLPTYETVGVWATVLLTLIRLLQGVSVGGELVGSIVFIVESAPAHQRGMYGSLALGSAIAGTTLGNVVGVILRSAMSDADFLAWGWRVSFLLGIVVGAFGLLLRTHVPEPPAFERLRQRQRHLMRQNPVAKAFRHHWREMAVVTGASLFWIAGIWVMTTWLPTYLAHLATQPTPGAFVISTVACFLFVLGFPAVGLLSDRVGRRRVMLLGNGAMVVAAPLLFWLYHFGQVGPTTLGVALHAVCMAFVGGPLPTWMVEGFPAHVRYSAVAIGYNIVTAIFGGTAPLVATAIVAANPAFYLGPALYVSGLALLATAVIGATPYVIGTRNFLQEEGATTGDGAATADDVELLPTHDGAELGGPVAAEPDAHDETHMY